MYIEGNLFFIFEMGIYILNKQITGSCMFIYETCVLLQNNTTRAEKKNKIYSYLCKREEEKRIFPAFFFAFLLLENY